MLEDIELGTDDEALILDMTGVTNPIEFGSDVTVANVVIYMTAEQVTAGTPVITWDAEGGAPANEAGVTVAIVDAQGQPTGDEADLIWDDDLGIAYIGPCEARLTGPTHNTPIYTTFVNAIALAAESGDTVTLLTNVTASVTIAKDLALAGAYTITGTTKVNAGATVTISDVAFDAAGDLYALDVVGAGTSVAVSDVTQA